MNLTIKTSALVMYCSLLGSCSSISQSYTDKKSYNDIYFSGDRHPYTLKCSIINIREVSIKSKGKYLKSDYFDCIDRSEPVLGDIIYVIGGPYQWIGDFPDPNVASFLMAGYNVYVPRYSGTFVNTISRTEGLNSDTVSGDGELGKAAREISLLIRYASKNNKEKGLETLSVGESAGSYILAKACKKNCTERVLFISPLMQSPIDFWKNYAEKAQKKNGPNFVVEGQSEDPSEAGRLASIGFYGVGNWDRDLCSILKDIPSNADVRIFYGDKDPRIGIDKVSEISRGCGKIKPAMSSFPDDNHSIIQSSPNGQN